MEIQKDKLCPSCNQVLAASMFNKTRKTKDGLQSCCRKCTHKKCQKSYRKRIASDEEWRKKRNAYMRKWCAEHPNHNEKWRPIGIRRNLEKMMKALGSSIQVYDSLLVKGCAICGLPYDPDRKDKRKGRIEVDHCHVTGKFRGLLCSVCNKGLGLFKDNPELLLKAIEYLEKARKGA